MKVKTKNRIKAAFSRLGDLTVIALIFFIFFLSVGIYGQQKAQQAFRQGYVEGLNARQRPEIETSLTPPNGALEAIAFEHFKVYDL